jgi:hypothetical protein
VRRSSGGAAFDNFYEWKKTAAGKQPYAVGLADDPRDLAPGKRICMTGQISDYRGKPEIVLTDPGQLTQ